MTSRKFFKFYTDVYVLRKEDGQVRTREGTILRWSDEYQMYEIGLKWPPKTVWAKAEDITEKK